jgi:CRP/FNR family cyclic AMP-dependent transcriptional regulator
MEYPLLASLTPEDRRSVLSTARRRRFAAGEVIVHEGDPGDAFHLIAKGRVGVRVTTPGGSVVLVNVHGRGSAVGEQALIDRAARRSATITALEPTETLSLSREAFDDLRRRHPGVDRLLIEVLSAEVRRLTNRLAEALYESAETRVLRRLVDLDAIYEGDIPLTQDSVASMAGTTRPTANGVLRTLVTEGVLVLRRGRIEVLDRAALIARAR